MTIKYTTPIPNEFLDKWMVQLSAVSIRVFLKIARNTLGWRDPHRGFKKKDWISHSQFGNVGVSSRSVTTAIDELLSNNLIVVTDEKGNSLYDPKKRKKTHRIYYSVHPNIIANFALNKAKTKENTPQYLPTTKEILQNSSEQKSTLERLSDKQRLRQILDSEQDKQYKRDQWL